MSKKFTQGPILHSVIVSRSRVFHGEHVLVLFSQVASVGCSWCTHSRFLMQMYNEG
jgi:hypothetical protein